MSVCLKLEVFQDETKLGTQYINILNLILQAFFSDSKETFTIFRYGSFDLINSQDANLYLQILNNNSNNLVTIKIVLIINSGQQKTYLKTTIKIDSEEFFSSNNSTIYSSETQNGYSFTISSDPNSGLNCTNLGIQVNSIPDILSSISSSILSSISSTNLISSQTLLKNKKLFLDIIIK
jgi:hypothetical protein